MNDCYEVSNLSYGWKNFKLFDNISFNIRLNKITAIAGPNGAGKSTLINLLSGILTNYSGRISLYGKNLKDYKINELSKITSYVKQIPDQNIPLPVYDIVDLGNFPYNNIFSGFKNNISRTEWALKQTGTEKLKDRYYPTLSGGEKQKVMIARAVCQSNKIIILDEPTSSLDIKNEKEIMNMLFKFWSEEKSTIIFVCHNINNIADFAHDLILLKENKIISGEVENIATPELLSDFFDTEIKLLHNNSKKIFYYTRTTFKCKSFK